MYCKTFRTKISAEDMKEFSSYVEKSFKPLISKQKGFKGFYFCTKENNEFVMIMLWEEKEMIEKWAHNPDHVAIGKPIQHVFVNEILQDIYHVDHFSL
jgi:heme-degrading monooxygenase HmoA